MKQQRKAPGNSARPALNGSFQRAFPKLHPGFGMAFWGECADCEYARAHRRSHPGKAAEKSYLAARPLGDRLYPMVEIWSSTGFARGTGIRGLNRLCFLTCQSGRIAVAISRVNAERYFGHLVRTEKILTPDCEGVRAGFNFQGLRHIRGYADRIDVLANSLKRRPDIFSTSVPKMSRWASILDRTSRAKASSM